MATIETMPQQSRTDRPRRSRPFSSWMKKLAHFKSSSSTEGNSNSKRDVYRMKSNAKKSGSKSNNPYIASSQGVTADTSENNNPPSTDHAGLAESSIERSRRSFRSSIDDEPIAANPARSVAPTVSTGEHDLAHSDIAQSHAASSGAGTSATLGPTSGREGGSTFSSPAPSVRSLTTTLTTIQSGTMPATNRSTAEAANGTSGQFSHQFPASPAAATAIPAHVTQSSGGHPSTYNTATANNLLTDNASILTLASSSKRRRRRSMDEDASVRALAPSSIFGGSRESLPLSVLSQNIDHNAHSSAIHQSRQSVNVPGERASIYSSTGIAPALSSDRNSYYAGKERTLGDGVSVKSGKSGLLGHGRTDSVSGSIGGLAVNGPTSPLASPNLATAREGIQSGAGRISRTNSGLAETHENEATKFTEQQ